MTMVESSMEELGLQPSDCQAFEGTLTSIIEEIGYPQGQIVRWESPDVAKMNRTGHILQYWLTQHGQQYQWPIGKRFSSTGLYFDTNGDVGVTEVFVSTRTIRQQTRATAIIAGTFELSPKWWFDRNVLGRLLSVSIGATNWTVPTFASDLEKIQALGDVYQAECRRVGLGKEICESFGRPIIPSANYTAHELDVEVVHQHERHWLVPRQLHRALSRGGLCWQKRGAPATRRAAFCVPPHDLGRSAASVPVS